MNNLPNQTGQPEKVKIIHSLWTFAIAVAVGGPFALPLLWRNPRFSKQTKVWTSVVIIVLTGVFVWYSGSAFNDLMETYKQLKALQDG